MKKLNTILFFMLILGVSSSFAQSKTDLTGTWVFDVETDAGSGSPTFVLKQDAEGKITGTYQGQLGESNLTGMTKDSTFHLEFTVQDNTIEYDGKIENDAVSGKAKLGTLAQGTFKGRRKE
ncbi:hypothetical protein [Persicitalea sp.]|uniref:hypothetical protein n=1 Tax=Persicitalea sp. TaxID=3100273 RepID=UPI003592F971